MSQKAHTKYKWPPYATELISPMKTFCVRHCIWQARFSYIVIIQKLFYPDMARGRRLRQSVSHPCTEIIHIERCMAKVQWARCDFIYRVTNTNTAARQIGLQRKLPVLQHWRHRRSQEGKGAMPPKCLEHTVILCFERRCSKQNGVIRLKSDILPLPNSWAGCATDWCWHVKRRQKSCHIFFNSLNHCTVAIACEIVQSQSAVWFAVWHYCEVPLPQLWKKDILGQKHFVVCWMEVVAGQDLPLWENALHKIPTTI